MQTKLIIVGVLALGVAAVRADGQLDFLKRQAYAEMQRVQGQIDVLQANHDELENRVRKIERSEESDALKAEVASLRAEVESLRRQLKEERAEIVKDLSARLAKLQTAAPEPAPVKYTGEVYEYVVQSGDSLYLIAKNFGTTVAKIKALNALKSDALKVGQKISIPKEK